MSSKTTPICAADSAARTNRRSATPTTTKCSARGWTRNLARARLRRGPVPGSGGAGPLLRSLSHHRRGRRHRRLRIPGLRAWRHADRRPLAGVRRIAKSGAAIRIQAAHRALPPGFRDGAGGRHVARPGLQLGTGTTDAAAGMSYFRRPTANLGCFVQVIAGLALGQRDGFIPSSNLGFNTGVALPERQFPYPAIAAEPPVGWPRARSQRRLRQ